MKKLIPALILSLIYLSCERRPAEVVLTKEPTKKYTIKTSQEKFDSLTKRFTTNTFIDTMRAYNDTVAYLTALMMFDNHKTMARENNQGEPGSFIIVDENGINLSVKLPAKIISGLKKEAGDFPDVKR